MNICNSAGIEKIPHQPKTIGERLKVEKPVFDGRCIFVDASKYLTKSYRSIEETLAKLERAKIKTGTLKKTECLLIKTSISNSVS